MTSDESKKLSPKEAFIKTLEEGASAKEAALAVFGNKLDAEVMNQKWVQKWLFQRLLASQAPEVIARELINATGATRKIAGEMVPDYGSRLKAIELLMKLLDFRPEPPGKHLHVHLDKLQKATDDVLEYVAEHGKYPD